MALIMALAGSALLASSAGATTVITSSAYGLKINLSVLSVVKASVGPLASTSGIAGQSYNVPGTFLSLDSTVYGLGLGTGLTIGTGLITTGAESNFPLTQTGSADALVNGLNLSLTAAGLSVIGLTANSISSHSEVEGVDSASATGSATINGLKLTILGLGLINLGASEYVNAAPGTDLFDLANLNAITGLSVILNEQVPRVGSDAKNAGITTNAIHLIFNNFLLGGIPGLVDADQISGDIIISQSRAYINNANSPTPEPATWIQMIAGFALVGATARRRRHALA